MRAQEGTRKRGKKTSPTAPLSSSPSSSTVASQPHTSWKHKTDRAVASDFENHDNEDVTNNRPSVTAFCLRRVRRFQCRRRRSCLTASSSWCHAQALTRRPTSLRPRHSKWMLLVLVLSMLTLATLPSPTLFKRIVFLSSITSRPMHTRSTFKNAKPSTRTHDDGFFPRFVWYKDDYHSYMNNNSNSTTIKTTSKSSLRPPTVHRLDLGMEVYPSKRLIDISQHALEAQRHLIESSRDFAKNRADDPITDRDASSNSTNDKHKCKAQYKWQLTSQFHPTCNPIHETDLSIFNNHAHGRQQAQHSTIVRLIANGYFRDVWTVRSTNSGGGRTTDGSGDGRGTHNATNAQSITTTPAITTHVMKTLRLSQDFTDRNFRRHMTDAMIMEKLANSPHVLDIYAYCANSGLFEYAQGGDVTRLIWGSSSSSAADASTTKLSVATQVTMAIADLHNVDKEGQASIAHTDISPGQFVLANSGMYKLNDFNRARLLLWSTTKDEPCGYHVGNNPGTNRSPEEYMYKKQSEKVDIYSLGNIFYMLLTREWPWESLSEKEAKRNVKRGKRPSLPKGIRDSKDPVDMALLEAMRMCQRQDPEKRASARQVEVFLKAKLRALYPEQSLV